MGQIEALSDAMLEEKAEGSPHRRESRLVLAARLRATERERDTLARALCKVEWNGREMCPSCHAWISEGADANPHRPCELDAALTAVGLDTQEKRRAFENECGGCNVPDV